MRNLRELTVILAPHLGATHPLTTTFTIKALRLLHPSSSKITTSHRSKGRPDRSRIRNCRSLRHLGAPSVPYEQLMLSAKSQPRHSLHSERRATVGTQSASSSTVSALRQDSTVSPATVTATHARTILRMKNSDSKQSNRHLKRHRMLFGRKSPRLEPARPLRIKDSVARLATP